MLIGFVVGEGGKNQKYQEWLKEKTIEIKKEAWINNPVFLCCSFFVVWRFRFFSRLSEIELCWPVWSEFPEIEDLYMDEPR